MINVNYNSEFVLLLNKSKGLNSSTPSIPDYGPLLDVNPNLLTDPDGTLLTTMADSSGNGNNLTAPVVPPALTYNAQGSFKGITFNGLAYLQCASLNIATASTFVVVYKSRTGTNGTFYSTNNATGPLQRNTTLFPDGNSNSITYGSDSLNTSNVFGVTVDYAGNKTNIYLDSVRVNTDVALSPAPTISGTTIRIGARGNAGEPLTGIILRFLYYNKILTPAEMLNLQASLSTFYGF